MVLVVAVVVIVEVIEEISGYCVGFREAFTGTGGW